MISSILLAGGQSKRMGRDKAFLKYKNKTFLRHILEKLDRFSSQIILSINKEEAIYKSELEGIKAEIKFVKDIHKHAGPLNAVVSCSPFVKNKYLFIATCDTPLISLEVVNFLFEKLKENENKFDCVTPIINGKIQPLNTFYLKKSLKYAEESYKRGNKSLLSWLDKLKKLEISENELKSLDPDFKTFLSINTPEMYQFLLERF
jgi:molybdopterin-guanine dinucleotide biosynthesis protein A